MEKNIDIIARLGQIVQENTTAYRSDFDYDVDILKKAAKAPRAEDRSFCWMSRPCGTWCVNEREVFLQGTTAHSVWTHYDRENEGFKAFRVVVHGMKDGRVMGDLYPLNYVEHRRRVEAEALPVIRISGQYADGTDFQIPFSEFHKGESIRQNDLHGGIKKLRYETMDEVELQDLLAREHYIETHRPPKKAQKKQQTEKGVFR